MISRLLGWNLHLQIALSTWSERLLNHGLLCKCFHLCSHLKLHFYRKYLIRQQFFDYLVIIHYLQQIVYSNDSLLYLRKKKTLCYKKLLSFRNDGFGILKNFILSFSYSRLQKFFFCFLKDFNEFSVRFSLLLSGKIKKHMTYDLLSIAFFA